MRIALDSTYSVDAQPSGIAVYSRELMEGLAIDHPEDHLVYCYRLKQYGRASKPQRQNVSKRILLPPLSTFRSDVFHALNQRVDRRPARRVVSTFHDLFVMTGEYSTPEFRQRFTKQARQAAERSDLIIAVSEFTATQVSGLLGIERQRIRVIAHGVKAPDPGILANARREKMILFVGALQARKNVKRLVQAFETMPAPWRLVLAGAPSGFQAGELLEQIAESRCKPRIDVVGYVSPDHLAELYSRASIFAFPSLDEGFGIPVLEAMASGVPVLASNGSALGEIANGAALLVDPSRVEAIALGLKQLAEDETLRDNLIKVGKIRVAEFRWDKAVESTYGVYRELLA